MALNMTQKYTKTEVWEVGSNKAPGTAVVQATSGFPASGSAPRPGVTITGSGDYSKATTVGPYSITGPAGAPGLAATRATVAIDGAFRFPVTGATNAIAAGTVIYAVLSGSNVTSLTTTSTGNTPFGIIDRFIGEESATECSIWIGRFVDLTA
jgi:hypothetical protein